MPSGMHRCLARAASAGGRLPLKPRLAPCTSIQSLHLERMMPLLLTSWVGSGVAMAFPIWGSGTLALHSWAQALRTEQEDGMVGDKLFRFSVALVHQRLKLAMWYTQNLPGMLVLLVNPDALVVTACLKRLQLIWRYLCEAEELINNVPSLKEVVFDAKMDNTVDLRHSLQTLDISHLFQPVNDIYMFCKQHRILSRFGETTYVKVPHEAKCSPPSALRNSYADHYLRHLWHAS